MEWSEDDKATLKRLWSRGYSARSIAQLLQRSEKAVYRMIGRTYTERDLSHTYNLMAARTQRLVNDLCRELGVPITVVARKVREATREITA